MPQEIKEVAEMQRVKVKIHGDVYYLRTDDPETLEKIVQMVNFHIDAVSQNVTGIPNSRLGVIAALRIAEEYMQLKKNYDEIFSLINETK